MIQEQEWVAPFSADSEDPRSLAPFHSTPDARIEEMIRLANVGQNDCACDLGCGDGSVLAILWRIAQCKVRFESY